MRILGNLSWSVLSAYTCRRNRWRRQIFWEWTDKHWMKYINFGQNSDQIYQFLKKWKLIKIYWFSKNIQSWAKEISAIWQNWIIDLDEISSLLLDLRNQLWTKFGPTIVPRGIFNKCSKKNFKSILIEISETNRIQKCSAMLNFKFLSQVEKFFWCFWKYSFQSVFDYKCSKKLFTVNAKRESISIGIQRRYRIKIMTSPDSLSVSDRGRNISNVSAFEPVCVRWAEIWLN